MTDLTPEAATLEAAQARVAELEAALERVKEDRQYIVGWNDGFAFATSARKNPEEHLHSEGAVDIARERERQTLAEGWTESHDDNYAPGVLTRAASCYALNAFKDGYVRDDGLPVGWPWADAWWKPKNARADLVRAGALIAAEIDRIDREVDRTARTALEGSK